MGASECSPKVAVLPATPHQVFTQPMHTTPVVVAPPIHPSCVFTDSRVVCHYSCLVFVLVWVSLSLALLCSRSRSLSFSAPPRVSTTHTRG